MSWMLRCLAAGVVAALAGCGGEPDAELRIPSADARPKSGVLPEKTATHPASPCDWIPAVEVEAVVGKLSGPPRKHEGGCFYPLPLDSITIARRAKTRQVEEALARAGMKSDWPAEPEDTAGVLIQVDVGVGAEERPVEQAFAMGASWVGNDFAIGVYGQLAMLIGDRMLEMAYLTSSTDIAGAIRLAKPALQRLGR